MKHVHRQLGNNHGWQNLLLHCCQGWGVAQLGWKMLTPRPKDRPAAAGAPGDVPAGRWPKTCLLKAEVSWRPSWHRFCGIELISAFNPGLLWWVQKKRWEFLEQRKQWRAWLPSLSIWTGTLWIQRTPGAFTVQNFLCPGISEKDSSTYHGIFSLARWKRSSSKSFPLLGFAEDISIG